MVTALKASLALVALLILSDTVSHDPLQPSDSWILPDVLDDITGLGTAKRSSFRNTSGGEVGVASRSVGVVNEERRDLTF